jgi:uncharacterized membrane protein
MLFMSKPLATLTGGRRLVGWAFLVASLLVLGWDSYLHPEFASSIVAGWSLVTIGIVGGGVIGTALIGLDWIHRRASR